MALFSILGSLEGRSFLDLFAGTGRIGLEALGRAASPVVWVEVLKPRAQAIERSVPPGEDTTVLALELQRAVRWLAGRERIFDVIFADPPYLENWGASLLKTKDLPKLLKPEGLMVVEHAAREELHIPAPWKLTDRRIYGETVLTFLRKE